MNSERKIWLNGDVLPVSEAKINVLSPTSQFGANVFEGIRCYWNEERQQLYAFRLEEHHKRLKESMKLFQMSETYTTQELEDAFKLGVQSNAYKEDITVRQTVFIDGMGSWSSKDPVGMFVAPIPKARKKFSEEKPMKCCVSSWARISDRCMSPRAKVGANYINSRLGQLEALEKGFDTCIFLNDRGMVSEGPGSCFFMVRNGVLITPTLTSSVLESITRGTLLELAKDILNIEVEVREIDRTELYLCEEAFLCGSMMEVGPIGKIDGFPVGDGAAGSITKLVHDCYLKAACSSDFYPAWKTKIY